VSGFSDYERYDATGLADLVRRRQVSAADLLEAAIERVKRRVKEEHYQIFDLYVVKQLSIAEVAETLGVSTAQVYLVKHRISGLIKKQIEALEQNPI